MTAVGSSVPATHRHIRSSVADGNRFAVSDGRNPLLRITADIQAGAASVLDNRKESSLFLIGSCKNRTDRSRRAYTRNGTILPGLSVVAVRSPIQSFADVRRDTVQADKEPFYSLGFPETTCTPKVRHFWGACCLQVKQKKQIDKTGDNRQNVK